MYRNKNWKEKMLALNRRSVASEALSFISKEMVRVRAFNRRKTKFPGVLEYLDIFVERIKLKVSEEEFKRVSAMVEKFRDQAARDPDSYTVIYVLEKIRTEIR